MASLVAITWSLKCKDYSCVSVHVCTKHTCVHHCEIQHAIQVQLVKLFKYITVTDGIPILTVFQHIISLMTKVRHPSFFKRYLMCPMRALVRLPLVFMSLNWVTLLMSACRALSIFRSLKIYLFNLAFNLKYWSAISLCLVVKVVMYVFNVSFAYNFIYGLAIKSTLRCLLLSKTLKLSRVK